MTHLIEENNKLKTEINRIKLQKDDLYFNNTHMLNHRIAPSMRKIPYWMVIYFSITF